MQVGDDVNLQDVPANCGYAYTPGWTAVLHPGGPVSVPDPIQPGVAPDIEGVVQPVVGQVPPRARILALGLTRADTTDPEKVTALAAVLEAGEVSTRAAWGVPPEALVLTGHSIA